MAYDLGDPALKQAVTDGDATSINGAVADIKARAEPGWKLTAGQVGEHYDWNIPVILDIARDFTFKGAANTSFASLVTSFAGLEVYCGSSGGVTTLRDLKFTAWPVVNNCFIFMAGAGRCFRLTNINVVAAASNPAMMWIAAPFGANGGAGPFGVIDNSVFTNTSQLVDDSGFQHFLGLCFCRQNEDSPDRSWANNHDPQPGSLNAVYWEKNTFNGCFVSDGNSAGKLVARYNTFNNSVMGQHGRDSGGTSVAAGTGPDNYLHSFLWREIYENVFNVTQNIASFPLCQVRGGSGYFFRNALNVSGAGAIGLGFDMEAHCRDVNNILAGEFCLSGYDGSFLTSIIGYPDPQQAGTPLPMRVWRNSNKQGFQYGTWIGAGESFMFHQGVEFFVSDGDEAAPLDYTPAVFPHPLNDGATDAAPTVNFPPSFSGIAAVAQTLVGSEGGSAGWPIPTKTFQWQRWQADLTSHIDIAGATSLNYSVALADAGYKLRLAETSTNIHGSVTAISAPSATVTAPGDDNLIANGSFEDHTGAVHPSLANNYRAASWDVDNGTGSANASTDADDGDWCWHVYGNLIGTGPQIAQSFGVIEGRTVTIRFRAKNTIAGSTEPVRYTVTDETNQQVIIPRSYAANSYDNGGGYCTTEATFVVPEGCAIARLRLDSFNVGGGAEIWVDNVVITMNHPNVSHRAKLVLR